MHDGQKIAVYVMFMQIIAKKGIKRHYESSIASMYKEYTQIYYIKVMGALEPNSLKKSQKRGALREIKLIK